MRLAPLASALLLASLSAQATEPLTLAQTMADPDWIGPPVEDAWWRWDGKAAQYTLKRKGATIRDTWQVGIDGGAPALLDGSARSDLDVAVESDADTLPAIIQEMLLTRTSERQGRVIDHDAAASMEKKKQEGYF